MLKQYPGRKAWVMFSCNHLHHAFYVLFQSVIWLAGVTKGYQLHSSQQILCMLYHKDGKGKTYPQQESIIFIYYGHY